MLKVDKKLPASPVDSGGQNESRANQAEHAGKDLDAKPAAGGTEDCAVDRVSCQTCNRVAEEDNARPDADLGHGGDLHDQWANKGNIGTGAETVQNGEGNEGTRRRARDQDCQNPYARKVADNDEDVVFTDLVAHNSGEHASE